MSTSWVSAFCESILNEWYIDNGVGYSTITLGALLLSFLAGFASDAIYL